MKEGHFGESSTVAICGSDHGRFYIFEVATGEQIQTLQHGNSTAISLSCTHSFNSIVGESLIQMIDVRHAVSSQIVHELTLFRPLHQMNDT